MQIKTFNTQEKVLVIAEIGNNHEGNFQVAQKLVEQAAECGVGAVKFQTFQTKYFVRPNNPKRYQQLSAFELSPHQFEELQRLATSLGLLFLSTPLDLESAKILKNIVDAYKIASGDNNFYPLIESVCQMGKPVIISSGLSDWEQVNKTITFVKQQWSPQQMATQLALLHCVTSYPVLPENANLASIRFLADRLECTVGYSDHTMGIEAAVLSVALGSRILEKHFTLDKNYSSFRDHQISADPSEMKSLVCRVEQAEKMMGTRDKKIQVVEHDFINSARRAIVAATDLHQGHSLTLKDVTWLRPADGLPPGQENQILGKCLKKDIPAGETIRLADVH